MSDSTDNKSRDRRAFSGSYERAVDPKGRFNLPFRFRHEVENQPDDYIVTLGADENLLIYTAEIWSQVFRAAKDGAVTEQAQALIRHISANTFDLTPDSQGRVMVPVDMLRSIGVEKRVLVVGMEDHLELWDTDVLTAHQAKNVHVDKDILRKFFS